MMPQSATVATKARRPSSASSTNARSASARHAADKVSPNNSTSLFRASSATSAAARRGVFGGTRPSARDPAKSARATAQFARRGPTIVRAASAASGPGSAAAHAPRSAGT